MSRQGVLWVVVILALVHSAHAALKTELIASGFARPLYAVAPPNDSTRLFILEQHTGRIRIIKLATKSTNEVPFLTVPSILTGGEQGLLGLAFHPGYETNGYFYINKVSSGGPAGRTLVDRYQVQGDPKTSDIADPATRTNLLTFDQPQANHNGGWMGFGPDGYLYIASGDGGGGYDQHGSIGNGQSRSTLLGKILRIDVNGSEGALKYAIPDGNPYKGSTSMRQEIWAFGLRNPWRCSFDRETGDLWIGDVGQGAREEIDINPSGVGGLNFGWRPREGLIQTDFYPNEVPVTEAVDPIHDYARTLGRSVTGGYVYRGSKIPELRGKYLFGDYETGRIWELTLLGDTNKTVREITAEIDPAPRKIRNVSSFGEDAEGELYICDYATSNGEIYKLVSDAPVGIVLQALQNGAGELEITFNALAGEAYALEATELLSAESSWTVVTNVLSGTERSVILSEPVTGDQRYFRLRRP